MRTSKATLGELCAAAAIACPAGYHHLVIHGITADSRAAGPGMLFVALGGTHQDGHRFVGDAVQNGCVAVLVERRQKLAETTPQLQVEDSAAALGRLAAAYYDFPGDRMTMIGITGTNGKTTSSYLLESIIRTAGGEPGIIGTVSVRYRGRETAAMWTTPPPVELQKILSEMSSAGVSHVIMEVSSHALAQQRVAGLLFDVALFTNISRDHLDFHGDMEEYFAAKQRLFTHHLKPQGRGVIVIDGEEKSEIHWGERLVAALRGKGKQWLTCGTTAGELRAAQSSFDLHGIRAQVEIAGQKMTVRSPLVGGFNLGNILGVVGCGVALKLNSEDIVGGIAELAGVPGRLERVLSPDVPGGGADISVFVDYAHTPDALEKVLSTVRRLGPRRLFVVFGCGGDRDHGKRPLMGEVAGRLADVAIVTSDNPRSESPLFIMGQVEEGVRRAGMSRIRQEELSGNAGSRGYMVIEERKEAIGTALHEAQSGDVVLICGKGHENYQIVGSRRLAFDDRIVARELLEGRQAIRQ